jgi:hypothetical protein
MKFMLLINQGTALEDVQSLPEDEQNEFASAWQRLRETRGVTPGEWLQPPHAAKTVRLRGGKPFTTDGPFAETKDAVGGYFLFEGESLDAALDVAGLVPSLRFGGAVEVRPIAEW